MSSNNQVYPVIWNDPSPAETLRGHVLLIDQTRLPNEYAVVAINRYEDMARAIETMIVRGAPAIGVAAAYGVYLGAREIQTTDRSEFLAQLEPIAQRLRETRPTAVNLFWAIDRMVKTAQSNPGYG